MGCATSRIEDSDVLMQCRNRKRAMKDAVNFRQDFAVAHLAYIQTLRNVGVALRRFAEGEFSADAQTSPKSPSTPVLYLPQTSSPPVAALSPPPAASALSPPPPPPPVPASPPLGPAPPKAASPPPSLQPSTSPRESPPASPFLEASPVQSAPDASPYADVSRSMSMHGMASPERGSDFSPPFYSPDRGDEMFMTFSPPRMSVAAPPPPSPPHSTSWFMDIFTAPVIPYHLQEQRKMKQYGEEEEEGIQDFDQVREEEGMPDLEEEEQKEEEKEQPEQDGVIQDVEETAPQISEDKAEEKVAEVSESKAENSPDKDEEEEKPSVVVTVAKELDMENDHKAKEKKELAVLTAVKGRNLKQVVRHIDDHFARAYDSGKDVSGMLETQMVYHYLNVLDLKDSSKVFNAITWYWSRKTSLAMRDAYEDSGDIPECGMAGSHASTLERLYAWEKKLYEEVKTGEVIRMAFDRKCRQLSILDRKGEDPTVIDKTRAAIKKLDTRLIVAFRAIHSASMRIQQLTNEELYPQLAELSGGLMNMWKVMLECHKTQKAIALEMQTLENSKAGDAADEMHRKATIELAHELEKWQNHFHRWISSQRKYINSLFKWLEQCRSQPEADVKGALDSMYQSAGEPKIYLLIQNWRSSLDQLENKQRAVDVISDFAAVVYSLESGQSEELNLKKQAERSAKGLHDKTLSLQHMERRFVEAPEDSSGKPVERHKSSLQERRADLDSLRTVVEEEKHRYSRAVQGRQETTLSSLRENLPMVFDSMASFATAAAGEYEKLQQETEKSISPLEDNDEMHDNLE